MKNKGARRFVQRSKIKTADVVTQHGSIAAVAALCGVTVQAVYAWGEFVPIKHAALFRGASK